MKFHLLQTGDRHLITVKEALQLYVAVHYDVAVKLEFVTALVHGYHMWHYTSVCRTLGLSETLRDEPSEVPILLAKTLP